MSTTTDPRATDALGVLRYRALAESMPQLVWATDANGGHVYYNRRWYEYTGLSEADSLGFGFANALHPDDLERTLEQWRRAWQEGASYEIEYRFRRHDGVYHWFIGRALPVRDASGQIVEWVGTCTDIDEQKRINETLAFLAEASELLGSSLDYEATLIRLVELAVPRISDWCALDILDPDGEVRRLAVAHVDPEKVALGHELYRRLPYDPDSPTGVPYVLRTGQSERLEVIDEEFLRAAIPDPELLQIFLDLGLRSSMAVPLIARGRTFGALTLVSAESGRRFTTGDLRLAEELARRAAVAIDNARLYRELRQFRDTLDQTLDSVFMYDAESLRFSYVNQGAIDQLGYSHDELLTMTAYAIKPFYTEESFRQLLAPLISGERAKETFETFHRHKDGRHIPVEVTLQYIDPADAEPRFVAVVRDISERRAALATLAEQARTLRGQARLIDLAHEAIIVRDNDGKILSWNRGAEELYGWSAAEALGKTTHELLQTHFPDEADGDIADRNRELLASGAWEGELIHTRRDSEQIIVESRQAAVHDESGARIQVLEINRDITARKRHEAELQAHAEQLAAISAALAERNRELDQFAYITSHDLKAPLRGIANLAGWIEEDLGDVPESIRGHLELMRGRVRRMEDLINGLLQYSRVGRTSGAVATVALGDLLEDVVDLLSPPPAARISIPPDMPTIRTDKLLLQQVFANLIGNALKHHRGDVPTVMVGWGREGRHYRFSVADNGPGIAPQYHQRIFGIFQTLAPRDEVEGSGLGLALVKKIVEHQGGKIWVESEEGRGATFHFTWPGA